MILRASARLIGIAMMLVGLLWVGQGFGWILWPASSFMLNDRTWAVDGGCLALLGLAVFYAGRRGND